MDSELIETSRRLLEAARLGALISVAPLPGGTNNRVFLVEHKGGRALLKKYFQGENDRDRMGVEFGFSEFARAVGAAAAPCPLARDRATQSALYEFVGGRACGPEDVSEDAVRQAGTFVRLLNEKRTATEAGALGLAADACLSPFSHVALVDRKMGALLRLEPSAPVDCDAAEFVHEALAPAWERTREALADWAGERRELGPEGLRVSPSDFGFHNALVAAGGRLRFFDFEYAGWDDPAKLVADFFGQVAVPVDTRHLPAFLGAAGFDEPGLIDRLKRTMPIHRYKWVCLLLNEFIPAVQARRRFASDLDIEQRKCQQLIKARSALRRAEESIAWLTSIS